MPPVHLSLSIESSFMVCGDLRSLQETEAAFILSPFSRERIILCKLGKMWKDVGTPADSYYQVRPDCTDVPESKFRIKEFCIGIQLFEASLTPPHITFMRKKDFRKEQLVLEDLVLEYIV
ncbi:uncharacterized protein LOC131019402 isoform X1 [Salvia miltiorrhiza]|uniref:uncharacterized protein LOC131019402 isoform X1 n=1 Tax=Salvia miltiorrhiza TaxID=226208 RepID=UPI0025AC792D|nr:uncharacterized protein LOC131019402 isoform X1 [Salvia miltiorrhiza]